MSPAPTMPTLVTGRAKAESGAPAGFRARFCTRSKAYRLARSSGAMIRSASASSSAAYASVRSAVLAAAMSSSARYGPGEAPKTLPSTRLRARAKASFQVSPRSTSGRGTVSDPATI